MQCTFALKNKLCVGSVFCYCMCRRGSLCPVVSDCPFAQSGISDTLRTYINSTPSYSLQSCSVKSRILSCLHSLPACLKSSHFCSAFAESMLCLTRLAMLSLPHILIMTPSGKKSKSSRYWNAFLDCVYILLCCADGNGVWCYCLSYVEENKLFAFPHWRLLLNTPNISHYSCGP